MNYLKTYCKLIRKAENRTLPEGYTENHHVFPKSIFGNNDRVVALTAREHYVAHALLEKIYIHRYGLKNQKTIKMTYAHNMMGSRGSYKNSYLYETVRSRMAEAKREQEISAETRAKLSASNSGKNNPFYGKTHSVETRKKLSAINKGRKLSPEARAKISIASKNISEETRAKLSFASKNRSEEVKAKMGGENNPKSMWWKITFSNGSSIERCGLSRWARDNNYDDGSINKVASGIRKRHKDIIKVEKIIKE